MLVQPSVTRRVLLIEEGCGLGISPMSLALRACETQVIHSDDVYRGLAILAGEASRGWACALVCVDGLAEREFEFFSLTRDGRGYPPVHVFSHCDATRRLNRAVAMGARRVVAPSAEALCETMGWSDKPAPLNRLEETKAETRASCFRDEVAHDAPMPAGDNGSEVFESSDLSETAASKPMGDEDGPLLTQEEIALLLSGTNDVEAAEGAAGGRARKSR